MTGSFNDNGNNSKNPTPARQFRTDKFNSSGPFYWHLPEALGLAGAKNESANSCTFEMENDRISITKSGAIEGFGKS